MHTTLKLMACALATGTLLAACGGGGKSAQMPATPSVIPDEAKASPESLTAWARRQSPEDSAEPLGMGDLVEAPASETLEPAPLD